MRMAVPKSLRLLSLGLLIALLVTWSAPAARAAAPVQQACYNAVVDGGFEQRNWWVLGGGLLPSAYITSPVHSGAWAAQMGNLTNSASIQAYSTIRQTVTIPVNATSAVLSFWVWTATEANPGNDRQEVLLLTPGASVLSASPGAVWSELTSSGSYRPISVDVSSQRGRTVDLTFSVYNDGAGGRTWMFVDDVALTICLATPVPTATTPATATPTPTFPPLVTATPTAVPTPGTPSPIPPNCTDLIANGGFEWDGAWLTGATAIRPFYAGPPSPVQSGNRSMALGAVLPASPGNVASYSSVQQSVTLPVTAQTAQIRFWAFPNSNAAAGGLNRQELILLDPLNYEQTIAVLWRVTQNANAWVYNEIDLTRFLGRTVTVYFNARNDGSGTRTGMYLDQVQVLACNVAIMPLADTAGSGPLSQPATGSSPAMGNQALPAPLAAAPDGQNTVIAVGANPAPQGEVTPGPLATPTATTTPPRNQTQGIDLGPLSPLAIFLVIAGVIVLAVVLAVLFFGNKDKSESSG